MDDLFRKLSAGAHFSKKAVSSEKRLDNKKAEKEAEAKKRLLASTVQVDELDFFGSKKNDTSFVEVSDEDKDRKKKLSLKRMKKPIFENGAELNSFRKEKGIRVYGEDVPVPIKRFEDLSRPEYGVPEGLITSLQGEGGLKKPTAVQMQATTILVEGRDAFVTAPTGSGKTLVFIIAILTKLLKQRVDDSTPSDGKIRAVVVSPTRELASQIKNEFRRFTPKDAKGKSIIKSVLLNKEVLCSWRSKAPKNFPEILITTPKRLVNGIEEGIIDLTHVQQIMLDEADKLLEVGLMEQMDDILAACDKATVIKEESKDTDNKDKDATSGEEKKHIQKALFSATIPTGVEDLARSFMSEDPIRVTIGKLNGATKDIKQELIYVGQEEGKLMAIRQMLIQGIPPPVIIFTETIEGAQGLFRELVQHGINVDIIHSSRTQAERERVIAQFRAGRIWFLITTELLARGLDFPEVACVINYDFPLSTASYIHRIGRTGRAGKRGKAITLFTRDDADALRIVANVMKQSGCDVPEWMLQLKREKTKSILKNRKRRAAMDLD